MHPYDHDHCITDVNRYYNNKKQVWIHYGNVNVDIDIRATTEEEARSLLAELLDKLNNS